MDVASEIGAARIARAMTLDDRAEWVLVCLMSGAGPLGMAGQSPHHEGGRPTTLRRPSGRGPRVLPRLHLRPRWDPTNEDVSKLRAAIRHRSFP